MSLIPYISIPTWNNGVWEYTEFETKDLYKNFVFTLFNSGPFVNSMQFA